MGRKGVSAGYSFKCKEQKGAVAIPGDYGVLCVVHQNTAFPEYIRQHHSSWCDLAQAIGLALRPEDIILVRGWLKTSEWAIAAVLSEGHAHTFSIGVDTGLSLAQAHLDIGTSTEVDVPAIHRSGPIDATERRRNQCLFLRYYKVKYRPGPLRFLGMKIVAGAGARDSDSYRDSEGSTPGAERSHSFYFALVERAT